MSSLEYDDSNFFINPFIPCSLYFLTHLLTVVFDGMWGNVANEFMKDKYKNEDDALFAKTKVLEGSKIRILLGD